MDLARHLAILQREGQRLATSAERTPLEAAVPSCPGWNLRDLLRHLGGIHRWATAHITRSRSGMWDPFVEMQDNWPSDDALLDWFRNGHAHLVQALQQAPDDLECFTFLPAPTPKAFWARRQAHETGMHRADAEGACGPITPFDKDQATDGIDELLFGFMSRPKQKLRTEQPRTLALHATDAANDWLVHLSQDEPRVTRDAPERADCRVSASASDLFLLVWNRRAAAGLEVEGDASLLTLWRQGVFVRWR